MAFFVVPPAIAEIVAVEVAVTGSVETAKVAVELVAGTVTLSGTVATPTFELFKVTDVPPGGAGPLRVTVPVDWPPPATAGGFKTTDTTRGAATMRVSDLVTPL